MRTKEEEEEDEEVEEGLVKVYSPGLTEWVLSYQLFIL